MLFLALAKPINEIVLVHNISDVDEVVKLVLSIFVIIGLLI